MSNLFKTNIEAKLVSYLKMKRTSRDWRNFFIKNQKRKKDNPVQGQIPSSSQIVIEEHKTESLVSDLDIGHAIGVHLDPNKRYLFLKDTWGQLEIIYFLPKPKIDIIGNFK